MKSCTETFSIKFCQEILCRDLVRRLLIETLYRDLVKRAEVTGLARRSFIGSLNTDITLRSLTKISCGDLL